MGDDTAKVITCTTLAEFLAVEADYYGAPGEERFEESELGEWVEMATDGVPLDELEPLPAVAARTVTIDHAAVGEADAEVFAYHQTQCQAAVDKGYATPYEVALARATITTAAEPAFDADAVRAETNALLDDIKYRGDTTAAEPADLDAELRNAGITPGGREADRRLLSTVAMANDHTGETLGDMSVRLYQEQARAPWDPLGHMVDESLQVGDHVAGKICERQSGSLIDYVGKVVAISEHGAVEVQVDGWEGTTTSSASSLEKVAAWPPPRGSWWQSEAVFDGRPFVVRSNDRAARREELAIICAPEHVPDKSGIVMWVHEHPTPERWREMRPRLLHGVKP